MTQLMILPAPTIQEDFTEVVFSDLLCSLPYSAGTDLSCPGDHTMSRTTDTINRSLRSEGDASEAAVRSEDRPQEPASETVGRVKYEKHIMSESFSQDCTDASLVDQAAVGNERAFELLVERYEALVWQFAYRRLARTDDVQDIVQFVFLQLYLSLPRLQGHLVSTRSQRPLKSWLLQVARNRCIDEHRKRHPCLFSEFEIETEEEVSPLEFLLDTSPLPEDYVEDLDLQRLLQAAIQTLPSSFRSIASLRCQEELSFREIGCRLNIPENTAKTYFQRARPLLRKALTCLGF
jgi:RNA polymerase sigma-70 factor (ECF subfamily)